MNGRTVFLDMNGDGVLNEMEPWVLTGDDGGGNPGYYQLSSLTAGALHDRNCRS